MLGLARAHAVGELERVLVAVMRDLWVLMAELATAPENRSQARAGRDRRDARRWSSAWSATSTRSTSSFDPPTEFVVPGRQRHRGVARPRPHRRAPGRAATRSPRPPPPSLVVPYLNRLSDLLWTMARWQDAADGSTLRVRDVADGGQTDGMTDRPP